MMRFLRPIALGLLLAIAMVLVGILVVLDMMAAAVLLLHDGVNELICELELAAKSVYGEAWEDE